MRASLLLFPFTAGLFGCAAAGPASGLAYSLRSNPHAASVICGYRVQALLVDEGSIHFTTSIFEGGYRATVSGRPVAQPGGRAGAACGASVRVAARRQKGGLGSDMGSAAPGLALAGIVVLEERTLHAPPAGLPAADRILGSAPGGAPFSMDLPPDVYPGAKYGNASVSGWLLNGWADQSNDFHWHNDYVFDVPAGTSLKFNAWCNSDEGPANLILLAAGHVLGAGRNVPDSAVTGPVVVTARVSGVCTEYSFSISRESRPSH